RVALEAALAGPAAGLVWLLLAGLSGGPVGGERLADVGPGPWAVGLAVSVAVAAGAVLSAALHQHRARP
ncbi:MAG: rane protein, partial [Frankiales bacterium]|nr:rane protein [Frankiales bacterium]